MNSDANCPKCGAPLSPECLGGVCPKCLLELAMVEDAGASGSAVGDSPAPESPVTDNVLKRFGDYDLLEEIAHGGMGVVYKARQRSLDRVVAIKMILAGQFATREFVQRFRTEAAAAAALKHPNIVPIHEVGVHDGQHFFSMDYVEGRDLSQTVHDSQFTIYDFQRTAGWVKTIAEAVHYAHQQGILHRDLKPANVLIDAHDQPHITDFGLAKRFMTDTATAVISFSPKLTVTGQMLGSPSYMPPEQATSNRGKVGPYSDVYALGAILYELITGRPPFRGETPLDTVRLSLETEPIAPRLLNSKVPLDLETICLKCLRKEPPHRYATARELAEDLDCFLTGKPIAARPVSAAAKIWRWCRRRPAVAGLSAAVGLLVVILAVGSTIAAYRFKREAQRTKEALRQTYVTEARLRRHSGEVGQRFRTLETLAKAAATGIGSPLELRNVAIQAMALPDLREVAGIDCPDGALVRFDDQLASYAQFDRFGSNSFLSIHRTADRRLLACLPLTRTDIMFHVSPHGRFVAIAFPPTNHATTCQIWEVASGEKVFETTVPRRGFPADFDGRGKVALGQLDGRILLYDLDRRRVLARPDAGIPANCLRFSPDGHYLAVSRYPAHEVVVLDLRPVGRTVARLELQGTFYSGLDWNDDGSRLAADAVQYDESAVVQVWMWNEGQARLEHILRGHQLAVTQLRFLPRSGFLVTSSYDGTTRFWSADAGRQVLVTPQLIEMSGLLTNRLGFKASPTRHSIQEFVADREFRTFPAPSGGGPFRGMALSPDGQLVALPGADGVRLWHVPTHTFLAHVPGAPMAVSFHPTDGSLVVAEVNRIVRWTVTGALASGRLSLGPPTILQSSGPQSTKFFLALSRDGTKVAFADRTRARVFDWNDPTQAVELEHGAVLDHVALNADGSLAVTGGGGFKVWDTLHRQVVFRLPRPGQSFSSFSPDNRWLVLSSLPVGGVQGGIHSIYRMSDWRLVKEVRLDIGPWPISDFAPDGRLLALRVTPSAIRFFDTRSWSEVATLEAPTQDPFSWFGFSRDGTQLAVACDNHSAQLWDLRAVRQQLATIGLDWNQPPYPPQKAVSTVVPRVVVTPR